MTARALLYILVITASCGVSQAERNENGFARYVALGDSYAAGYGSEGGGRSYNPESGSCKRCDNAYPFQFLNFINNNPAPTDFKFLACTGAKIPDVYAQISQVSNEGWNWDSIDVVTLSVGGNDANFSEVMSKCRLNEDQRCHMDVQGRKCLPSYGSPKCDQIVTETAGYISNTLPGELTTLYKTLSALAKNAKIYVTGYPKIFSTVEEDCHWLTDFTKEERVNLNGLADKLATAIRHGVITVNGLEDNVIRGPLQFVDVREVFLGHEVCTDEEWITNVSYPKEETFHPNILGQQAYGALLATCFSSRKCT